MIYGHAHIRDCIVNNTPYWGSKPIKTLASPIERLPYLADLVRRLDGNNHDIRVLEIGSFIGASAVTMALALQKYHGGTGLVYCIDPWFEYPIFLSFGEKGYLDKNGRSIASYAYEDMFRHNVKASGVESLVVSFRGTSMDILPVLAKDRFDLVYIDGLHSHAGACFDLVNSMPLVRVGGILCGDDLELQVPDVPLLELMKCDLRGNSAKYNDISYHPGVTLAINETFKSKISCVDGLWARRKTMDDTFCDIEEFSSIEPDRQFPAFFQVGNVAEWLSKIAMESNWKAIVLYGAGRRTTLLLKYLKHVDILPAKILGVVDDNILRDSIEGVPIMTRQEALCSGADALVLSSEAYEDVLAQKAAEWCKGIPVIRLYGDN